MRYILVDGYNVIRGDPRLQAMERVNLEQARNLLVQILASSPRLAHDHIVVVFDGADGSRSHVHSQRRGRVEMLYSARGQQADDVIVSYARDLAPKEKVVVVSNDVEVRESSRAAGADISGTDNLLNQMPGSTRQRFAGHDDDERGTLSTRKRGNPRRSSKKARQRDIRF
ncbi:MAG: hypothetical protein NVS2B16_03850 [Chloroflexota bacterium]